MCVSINCNLVNICSAKIVRFHIKETNLLMQSIKPCDVVGKLERILVQTDLLANSLDTPFFKRGFCAMQLYQMQLLLSFKQKFIELIKSDKTISNIIAKG